MQDEQTTFTYYALEIKGSFYDASGLIVDNFDEAKLFKSQQQAIAFRAKYDPAHHVTCSMLLSVQILISEL